MIIALIGGIVMGVLLAVDLITKLVAEALHVNVTVIPGFMNFRYQPNSGMAFGTFENTPWVMNYIVTPLTVVMIIAIAVLFFTVFKKNTPARMALAVIEAGACGNLVDRLCLGYVRDFVDVGAFRPFAWLGSNFNFGNCNIADFYITFGAIALLVIILFVGKEAVIPLGKYRRMAKEEEAREAHEAQQAQQAHETQQVVREEPESPKGAEETPKAPEEGHDTQ